ncbi:hypothetical protein [Dictyobacter arantiisoli]|uniref:Uncharacterized protein n=1 Tax=Dictyobacter arantiisoli TaxID=2014874 RepID=A0A5A5T6F2_9CHLR|nr:hypothetical protein [Dictyobacter arantiisoli]GCF06805.1 hypothetical protein KDI_03690 [Dictyobacter arantiisoli]
MKLFGNEEAAEPASTREQLAVRLGIIFLAAVLIIWLSGGFPPTVWTLLIKIFLYWNVYWSTKHNGLGVPLIILIIQSLLLLVAWILLIVSVVREIRGFLSPEDYSSPIEPVPAVQAVQTPEPAAVENVVSRSKTARQATQMLPPTPTATRKRAPAPDATENTGSLRNPFEIDTQPTVVKAGTRKQTTAKKSSDASNSRTTKVPEPASKAYTPRDPFDVQLDVLDLFDQAQQSEDDPFSHDKVDIAEEQTIVEEPEQEEPAEFVYGNPFEGPLPEVFEYDADLKRSVDDMNTERDAKAAEKLAASKDKDSKKIASTKKTAVDPDA